MAEEPSTLLVLSGLGIPPYSARGLTQTLQPIDAARVMRRTINGILRDISQPQFKQYKSTIQCTDQQSPAVEGYWPGNDVTVHCVVELSYLTGSTTPERPVVPGSSRVEGDFTFYRPQLEMKIIDFNIDLDEWGADVGWTMELEERG